MKIISIVGARPQFIKLYSLCKEIENRGGIRHTIIHTGQHYDYEMSKIFFDELHIPRPDYNLQVGSYAHGKQTALMLERVERVLCKEKRIDYIFVYGDTNSTLAGALAAVKMSIPVVHVEAGLRSFKMNMPEEINRILTDRISTILFCPTPNAVKNLAREGMTKGVHLVGDLMREILCKYFSFIEKRKIIYKLGLKPKEYYLLTVHREENADNYESLKSILSSFTKTDKKIVFPAHPRLKDALRKMKRTYPGIFNNFLCIRPIGYFDMVALEKNASQIITDSGGVQKEAYWLNVPCITLRNETEWPETLKKGCNVLTGTSAEKIRSAININSTHHFTRRPADTGTGIAKHMIDILLSQKGVKC